MLRSVAYVLFRYLLIHTYVILILDELVYACNMDTNVSSEVKMHDGIDHLSHSFDSNDLIISIKRRPPWASG